MIGIIGAMKEEVASFLAEIKQVKKEKQGGSCFYHGVLFGKEVVVVQCGVGKVNAAIATQIMIDRYAPQRILFTGLAGSGCSKVAIGDFVLATALVQHDFDLTHFGREKGMVPAVGRFLKSDPCFLADLEKAFMLTKEENPQLGDLHKGVIASGDCFVADRSLMESITKEFDAIAVEMEGAAVAQVCFLNEIPCVILRLISDHADEKATVDFQAVLDKASLSEIKIIKNLLLQNKEDD